jgi:hypothetical protein
MNAAWRLLIFATHGLLLAGCATTQVTVDSLAKPKAEASISYQLNDLNPLATGNPLRYQEAVGYVQTALSGKGLYEAPKGSQVDLVIDFEYGIDPADVRQTVYAGMDGLRDLVKGTVGGTFGEDVTTTIVYKKFIKLTARETAPRVEGHPPVEVWTITVTSEGESRDLRKILPILVAASIEYIGKDSHGETIINLKDNDPAIAFVKKGM